MTPRVDHDWSNELIKQTQSDGSIFNLRSNTQVFAFKHPAVLKALLEHKNNPQQEYPIIPTHSGWNLFCFNDSKRFHNDVIHKAHPHVIWEILNQKPNEAILDFDDLGCVLLTLHKRQEKTELGVHHKTLPLLLDYVFSQDQWGPQGKWTRFHQRLHGIFEKYKLVSENTVPGRYPLTKRASILGSKGFLGTETTSSYVLTMPWTFPLSGLEKLEKTIMQEF
jgi:hypothetical protein